MKLQSIACAECGADRSHLDARLKLGEQPQRCPAGCGETRRLLGMTKNAKLVPRSRLAMKARRRGTGKPFWLGWVYSDYYRDGQVWTRVERIVNRANDWYREHISVRATGQVIKHVEEPLSDHVNHGSAKRQKRST